LHDFSGEALRIFLIAVALATTVPALAQIPAPAEQATRSVLAALNGSESDRSGLLQSFSAKALENESAADRLRWLDRIAADSGGVTVVSLAPQGDRMVEAIVKTNRGGKFGKLVVFTSRAEPGKIGDVFLLAARDPAKVKAEAWPTGPLPLSRIAGEINKRAASLVADDSFSGVVLVAKGDRVLVNRAYGFADQLWRAPNHTDTRFHLGSIGKMFTAAAIMKLAEQGKLSLDDPLSKWVPEYAHPEATQITLKQLLTHSAGVGDLDIRQIRQPMTGAAIAATMTQPLEFKPGERFGYSNGGFVLLQAVVERASGQAFDSALGDLVFKPAGMTRTGTWPVTAIVPNRATGYLRPEDDPLGLGPRYSNEQFLGYGANGSGGEYSTVGDLFLFLSALANGKLLGPGGTKEMLAPRVDVLGGPRPAKYGYGVELTACDGHAAFGHEGGGANSGVDSTAYRTLDTGWTVIVLSNYDPPAPGDLALGICEFVAGR
jgi:CubicO group peptidase (beta-lactamase class C family)